MVALITFYQRFISPLKGFKCAHNALHQQGSCSHSVKKIVIKYGVFKAMPMARLRFKECSRAYDYLKTNPVPFNADLPCDIGIGECITPDSSTGSSACDCLGGCDFLPDWKDCSKKTRRRIITISLLGLLIMLYVFYGRAIESIYVIDKGAQHQSIFTRLVQRNEPEIRMLLMVDGRKYYSDIVVLKEEGVEYRFRLDKPFLNANFERLEVLDARLNVANKLLVIGQVLEAFDAPEMQAQGQRFDYRIKRRWHFL